MPPVPRSTRLPASQNGSSTAPDPAVESGLNKLVTIAIALLFAVIGLGAIGLVIKQVADTLALRVDGELAGTTLLRFLNTNGIIFPLLLIGIGAIMLRMAISLYRLEAPTASWARQILLWLVVACGVMFVQALATTNSVNTSGTFSVNIEQSYPFLIVALILAIALWWLNGHMRLYHGTETLSQASSRVAWNLLLPTIVLLILVALRPLEATFVASLTDRVFASSGEPNFVGLENYAELLGVRLDSIPCERGDDGQCARDADGAITFPSVRDYLESLPTPDNSYHDLRFRKINSLVIGETQIVYSARDRDFVLSIGNTLTFTFFSVALELTFGLGIAMIINSKFAGRGLMRAAMLVPWAIPTVVSAKLWQIMLRDNLSGVINSLMVNGLGPIVNPFLNLLGMTPITQTMAWLANSDLQLPSLIAIDVWKTTPFMALILLAGLQTISADLYEAADVDGASKVRQFFSVTLPLLRPTIAVALVFRTLDAVRVFDVFQVLLGDKKFSMATYNYSTLVNTQQAGYASAIGVLIFILILAFTVAYVRVLGVTAE